MNKNSHTHTQIKLCKKIYTFKYTYTGVSYMTCQGSGVPREYNVVRKKEGLGGGWIGDRWLWEDKYFNTVNFVTLYLPQYTVYTQSITDISKSY